MIVCDLIIFLREEWVVVGILVDIAIRIAATLLFYFEILYLILQDLGFT